MQLIIGSAVFESLVELVEYYKKNSLYRKMKLRYAVTDDLIRDVGTAPTTLCNEDSDNMYYTEPAQIKVRALYDYNAERPDELSFCKHAYIVNVQKQDGGWWRGDYGDQKQMWFPANYVEEVDSASESADVKPLGNLQQGTIELAGVSVDRLIGRRLDRLFIFRVITPDKTLELGSLSEEEVLQWVEAIRSCSTKQSSRPKREKAQRIAKELTDLIVYCRPVAVDLDKVHPSRVNYYEMFSLPEQRVEKFTTRQKANILLGLNTRCLSRIYPKGSRIDSSNYDPIAMWNCGCHMTALNYQTPDRPMQLNDSRFRMNGRCGYVLQPDCMRHPLYNPFDKSCLSRVDPAVEPVTISLVIIGARHLVKSGRGIVSPFVEVKWLAVSMMATTNTRRGFVLTMDLILSGMNCVSLIFSTLKLH
jgi:phosphatidylinositol phospholipase C gamma-1